MMLIAWFANWRTEPLASRLPIRAEISSALTRTIFIGLPPLRIWLTQKGMELCAAAGVIVNAYFLSNVRT